MRTLLLAFFLLVALAMRIDYMRHGAIIVDEFQHLHASYLVSRGEVPYRDFFEHHPPLVYYLTAAIVPMGAPTFDTIIQARFLSLTVHTLGVLLIGLWIGSVVGVAEGVVVACLVAGNFFLFAFGTLCYLDPYAVPLLVASAWALGGSRGQPRRCFLSGATLGLAVLITQKAYVAGLAALVVFLARAWHELGQPVERRTWLRDLGAYAAGGFVPALLLPALLGVEGTAGFLRDGVILNLHWKARHAPIHELEILAGTDAFIYLVALLGLVLRLRSLVARHCAVTAADVPALFLAALGTGIFLLPVVWEEYFILLVPFATVVAGMTLTEWWRRHLATTGGPRAIVREIGWPGIAIAVVLLAAGACALVGRRLMPYRPISAAVFAAVPGLWMLLGLLVVAARRRDRSIEPALWLALVLVFPVMEQGSWSAQRTNDDQRARVEYVLRTTSGSDTILDGFSGFGVFRPHAYRYWALHEEIQLMLSPEEKSTDILHVLEEERPRLVIVDEYLRMLPRPVLDYVDAHYVATPFPDIKRRAAAAEVAVSGVRD